MNAVSSRMGGMSMPPAVRAAFVQLAALSPNQLSNLNTLLTLAATMSNPVVLVPIRNADGTQGLADITLAPGQMITADANGNVTTSAVPTVLAEYVGDIDLTGVLAGATGAVTFPSAFPSADYFLNLNYNGLAGLIQVTAKTVAGFTYKVVSVVAGKLSFDAKAKGQAR